MRSKELDVSEADYELIEYTVETQKKLIDDLLENLKRIRESNQMDLSHPEIDLKKDFSLLLV